MEEIQPREGLTDWGWQGVIVRPLRGRNPVCESVAVGFTYGYLRCCPSGKREGTPSGRQQDLRNADSA